MMAASARKLQWGQSAIGPAQAEPRVLNQRQVSTAQQFNLNDGNGVASRRRNHPAFNGSYSILGARSRASGPKSCRSGMRPMSVVKEHIAISAKRTSST